MEVKPLNKRELEITLSDKDIVRLSVSRDCIGFVGSPKLPFDCVVVCLPNDKTLIEPKAVFDRDNLTVYLPELHLPAVVKRSKITDALGGVAAVNLIIVQPKSIVQAKRRRP